MGVYDIKPPFPQTRAIGRSFLTQTHSPRMAFGFPILLVVIDNGTALSQCT